MTVCVSAEHSGICICIGRFILVFINPRRGFGISQNIALELVPVTVALPKVRPNEGALVQGSLFLSFLRVMHRHICVSCGVCKGIFLGHGRIQGPDLLLRLFSMCAVGCCSAIISSLQLDPRTNSYLSIH